jgi:uncharacterized heparinase superfamily protein
VSGTLLRYWNTIRYLRPSQIVGRATFRLLRPRLDARMTPPRLRQVSSPVVRGCERRPSMIGPRTFRFLNETRDAMGWDDPAVAKLWRYNLHYFDDLNASGAAGRSHWHRDLIARWIAENPPTQGSGWEPYPTSLRIVNWIRWALSGNELGRAAEESLALQARWLSMRLETHLLGNHLFVNAKALVFAGLFFQGDEADEWLRTGVSILARELPEQILADGAQFELSPMYHALATEDVLDLCAIVRCYDAPGAGVAGLAPRLLDRVPPMLRWLDAMTHPDGDVAFFNDAAFGIAPKLAQLTDYAARLGVARASDPAAIRWMPHSGYLRADVGAAALIADFARVGPDYLPGHAHADTLSIELSLRGQRLIVNSGTSVYGNSSERQRQRGTAAHSTVAVDDADSSEVWGGFRVARRARVVDVRVDAASPLRAQASHDGYTRLPGNVKHRRALELDETQLLIVDELQGDYKSAQARFHLHPSARVSVISADGLAATVVTPDGANVRFAVQGAILRTEAGSWHPEFGVTMPNECLVATFGARRVETRVQWA